METYFQGFHEDEQFSTNLMLSNLDEPMRNQLTGLESIKIEENSLWGLENIECPNEGKEDFHQIMSEWQECIGVLQSPANEDLGIDLGGSVLKTTLSNDLYEESESPILSKALKYPSQKAPDVSKDSFLENVISSKESLSGTQKLGSLIKAEPNLIRKVTLVNGEKEILGKNIIGLHCLNEIKENPDENCQITSTIINGKRYKIIIKPKSLKVKKLSEEKIRKTLIKKLMQCHLVTKMEPKEDEIISEMCNGNYDVPLHSSDLLPSWDFAAFDCEWSSQESNDTDGAVKETEVQPERKVPPLRVKIPKLKKHKKKSVKSDKDVDEESSFDNEETGGLKVLSKNLEEKTADLEKSQNESSHEMSKPEKDKNLPNLTTETIKNSLPNEIIDKIEALKRKKKCRIPLIQAMPTKKTAKNGTRMMDAVATMNRNKLLKIVSGGDAVQMDHDYCSTFIKKDVSNKCLKKQVSSETKFTEKNPKKDSGMESGDVSDASEGPNTPDSLQSFRKVNNKVLEERRRFGDHTSVTKAAVEFFRASNAATVNGNTNSSDSVKTKTVSNGNKVLTNSSQKSESSSDISSRVPSDTEIINKNHDSSHTVQENSEEIQENVKSGLDKECQPVQNERPKKKLKLEEYLNRRHLKEKEKEKNIESNTDIKKMVKTEVMKSEEVKEKITDNEITKKQSMENECLSHEVLKKKEIREKYWKTKNRRSSSVSSGERSKRQRRRSRSNSRLRRRSSSSSSCGKGQGRGKHRYSRRSESREKKRGRGFWSASLSRSSSRESSTSSEHSAKKYSRNSSRYRRRSRSRSVSRGRSVSRNRGFKRRRQGNYYYNRNLNYRRSPTSKSSYHTYSFREKQRQIEERRVIYVGRIEEGMTNSKLRERFSIFGPIIDISLHFREYGDNYGFVTYAYKSDAYDAVEHGNDDPSLPHYDLCFGGRRGFCKEKYADLDGMPTSYSGFNDNAYKRNTKDSFDLLLKEAQAKLKSRKI